MFSYFVMLMFELWKFIVNSKARKSAEKQFHVNNQALHNFSSTLNNSKCPSWQTILVQVRQLIMQNVC